MIGSAVRAADERWADRLAGSQWSAAAIVTIAWGLIAANRLGGLTLSEPRSFVRLAVVGIWGWLALSALLWIILRLADGALRSEPRSEGAPGNDFGRIASVTGWAHVPILLLSIIVFMAAGALEILGPGRVAAVAVFAIFVPFALVTGVRAVAHCSLGRAGAIAVVPYALWLFVIVRDALDSINHLL